MVLRVIKIVIGATLAIVLAEALGLKYTLAAGVIVILSIQETKKKSLDIALLRLKSTILALTIGSIVFLTFGFHPAIFGIYLLFFLPLAYLFKLNDGIVVSSVLVTHLLGEGEVSLNLVLNGMLLLVIGVGIAILFNLYMPKMLPQIKSDQQEIEEKFRDILLYLSNKVRNQHHWESEAELFNNLKELLSTAHQRADNNRENYFLEEMTYYVQYMQMRYQQLDVLSRMSEILDKVESTLNQTTLIADLTQQLAQTLHEFNSGSDLIIQTENVLTICRNQPLPQTREEFENRALLFQYLNEFRHLLEIKRDFIANLTRDEKKLISKTRSES